MPAIFLRNRAGHLVERMDLPDCDPVKLLKTYRQFKTINYLLSGWSRIYSKYLKPALQEGAETVLDIGCGGGDISRMICKLASRDGFNVRITAMDTDERALAYMRSTPLSEDVTVSSVSVEDFLASRQQFDIVLSNNVLHHIPENELPGFMDNSRKLAQRLVIHSDIRRDDLAYVVFLGSHLFFRGSFIAEDGLTSIRKSYRMRELRRLLSSDWDVHMMALYRNLCIWKP